MWGDGAGVINAPFTRAHAWLVYVCVCVCVRVSVRVCVCASHVYFCTCTFRIACLCDLYVCLPFSLCGVGSGGVGGIRPRHRANR